MSRSELLMERIEFARCLSGFDRLLDGIALGLGFVQQGPS
jgi:hypothetical protein